MMNIGKKVKEIWEKSISGESRGCVDSCVNRWRYLGLFRIIGCQRHMGKRQDFFIIMGQDKR